MRNTDREELLDDCTEIILTNEEPPVQNRTEITIQVYDIRWLILFVICLTSITTTINWICYSSIANYAAKYYGVGFESINFISLVFIIASLFTGLLSFFAIEYFGIRTSIYLSAVLNLLGATTRLLSSISLKDNVPLIDLSHKFTVLMIGQVLCAFASPFIQFITTKFSTAWFPEDQRVLANALCLTSNSLGLLIGTYLSPQIVTSSINFDKQIETLNYVTFALSLLPLLLALFIRRSTPLTPPSFSEYNKINETQNQTLNESNQIVTDEKCLFTMMRSYWQQLKKLLKCKDFLILSLSFGLGLGLFDGLATLSEQILCVRGYTDDDVGLFTASMIFCGIIGSLITSVILDKTKKFEETAKICFCFCTLASIAFALLQAFNNESVYIKYSLYFSLCLIGLFGVPLLPICMELAVECVYPISEAATSGILLSIGECFSIFMIVVYPKISRMIASGSYIYDHVQKCDVVGADGVLKVLDYTYPLYGQTVLFALVTIVFIICFKCDYLRLQSEKQKE